jgi:secreted Zn-dependent insulinase-like peptidase
LNKASVALYVNSGHFNDPNDCAGTAHLLEHMLFLGSKQFPRPNSLHDFVAQHNGSANALTDNEYSHYFFDVDCNYLPPAIECFTDMLLNPLLNKQQITSEIQAIDAEFKLKQQDDLRRLHQVHKETSNPAHPFSRFSTGNKQTLTSIPLDKLRKRLEDIHQQFFRASNMALCIISPLKAEEMLSLVDNTLGELPALNRIVLPSYPSLYLPKQLGVQINVKPLRLARRLILTFAMPRLDHLDTTKPLELISHLIGDESSYGLLDTLRQQGWISSLSAEGGIQGSHFRDFNINIQLTATGLIQVNEVIDAVFRYIDMIRVDQGIGWRFEEKSHLGELAFHYAEKCKPLDEAIQLASQMFIYPPERLLSGPYLMDNFDRQAINFVLEKLTPENLRIKIISPEAKTNQKTQWYDTHYSIADHKLTNINMPATPSMLLPPPNPYIVREFQAQDKNPKPSLPYRAIDETGIKLWLAKEDEFTQPKGNLYLSFDCLNIEDGISMQANKKIWIAALSEVFSSRYYQAEIAGLHHHLYSHQYGFTLRTSGFNVKQLTFFEDLLNGLRQTPVSESLFERAKIKQIQSLKNNLLNKPINRLFNRLSVLMQPYNYSTGQWVVSLQNVNFHSFSTYRDRLLEKVYLEGLLHGNWQVDDAIALQNQCEQLFNCHNTSKINRNVLSLPQGYSISHQVISDASEQAIVWYFQAPSQDLHHTALTILLEQLLAVPFFNVIRTQKQIGYLVGTGYLALNQHPGIILYAQSPQYSIEQLLAEFRSFLELFRKQLIQEADRLDKVKRSLVRQLTEKETNLAAKSQKLWIATGNDDLSRNKDLAVIIAQIEIEDLINYCQLLTLKPWGDLILFNTPKPYQHKFKNLTQIDQISDFKSQF